jgi:hypothetical protein
VKVYDLLNQNQSATRTISPTTITDEQNTVLRRYMMFSLTYKIEKFGGKKSLLQVVIFSCINGEEILLFKLIRTVECYARNQNGIRFANTKFSSLLTENIHRIYIKSCNLQLFL